MLFAILIPSEDGSLGIPRLIKLELGLDREGEEKRKEK